VIAPSRLERRRSCSTSALRIPGSIVDTVISLDTHLHDLKTRCVEPCSVVGTLPRVRRQRTRWEEDNEAPLNPWAFLVVGGFLFGIAALVIWLSLA
jgi:hypothetical protein